MRYLTLLVVFLATLVIFGCSQQAADQAELKEIEARENLPIWSRGDFDYRGTVLVYDVVINQKPPYYRGNMPLHFKQSQLPTSGYYMESTIILKYEFDDYCVMFTRDRSGACAIDKTGKVLLAEARLRYFVAENEKMGIGIEVEEFHYGQDGDLTFYCKSQLKPVTMHMYKQSESERLGKKKKEYFFIWPLPY